MIKVNFAFALLAAVVPMLLGMVWYSEKMFGRAWLASTLIPEDKLKGTHMAKVFIVTYISCVLVAVSLYPIVIHQFGMFSALLGPGMETPGTELNTLFMDLMGKYGTNYRTFKHGALHGTITGLLFATPIITVGALFEGRGFKYIAINGGYWIISMALMGGIICQFA